MANTDFITAVKKSLCVYLKANMASIVDVKDDFPSPSENLTYPCATVITGKPSYESITPYVFSKGTMDAGTKKALVRRVVGTYEMKLQVDLWSAYKSQRPGLYEEFFKAINKVIDPMGLSLQLTDYYSAYAHYHIDGFDFPDSEEQSQRKEWRAIVSLVCTVDHIVETLEYIVETIENNTDITEETLE